jgi:hypothetical protein
MALHAAHREPADSVPRRPFLTMSPSVSTEVGSPTMQQSSRSPRACSICTTRTVPSVRGPSSSLVSSRARAPACVRVGGDELLGRHRPSRRREVFMSAAPRP